MSSRRTSATFVSGESRKTLASAGGGGDITGPGSSSDNAIVRWDGTTGDAIQNSGILIADTTDNMTFPAAAECQFRTSANKIYSPGAGQLTVEATIRTVVGVTGTAIAEFGDGTNGSTIAPTSGSTLDVGSTGSPIQNAYANGAINVQAGNASSTWARCGGTLSTNATAVGNVGTGEDDLMTYSVPASTLATDLDHIIVRGGGTCAANANNKNIKVKFGGTTVVTSGALALNGADWRFMGEIIRTSATTQKACFTLETSSALLVATVDYTTPGETLSGAVTLKVTGEATSNDDIKQEYMIVQWFGA